MKLVKDKQPLLLLPVRSRAAATERGGISVKTVGKELQSTSLHGHVVEHLTHWMSLIITVLDE